MQFFKINKLIKKREREREILGENLIRPRRKRLSNKSRDLIHELIRFSRMQDSSKATHLRIGSILEFLKPVVHDPALPSIVDGSRRGYGGVK